MSERSKSRWATVVQVATPFILFVLTVLVVPWGRAVNAQLAQHEVYISECRQWKKDGVAALKLEVRNEIKTDLRGELTAIHNKLSEIAETLAAHRGEERKPK